MITVARHHCQDVLRRKKRLGKSLTRLGAGPVSHGEVERAVVDRNFVRAVLGRSSCIVPGGARSLLRPNWPR